MLLRQYEPYKSSASLGEKKKKVTHKHNKQANCYNWCVLLDSTKEKKRNKGSASSHKLHYRVQLTPPPISQTHFTGTNHPTHTPAKKQQNKRALKNRSALPHRRHRFLQRHSQHQLSAVLLKLNLLPERRHPLFFLGEIHTGGRHHYAPRSHLWFFV